MDTATRPTTAPTGLDADPAWLRETRPRLRHDVVFADVGNGVYLRDATGGMLIKGGSAYRLTASIAPYLTGEHALGDLCGSLPAAHRTMVTDLVRALLDRGYVRNVRPSTAVSLEGAVRDRFRSQLNYIEHYVDDAAARFARFRSAQVLILGTGPMAVATGLALLRNGMGAVSLASWVPPASAPAELIKEAQLLDEVGCPAEVRVLGTAVPELDAAALAPYRLVVAPADRFGLAEVLRLSRLSGGCGPALLPTAVVGDQAVLGPLQSPGSAPCWVCATLRLGASQDPPEVAAMWRDIALPELAGAAPVGSDPLAAMVGNLLGYEVFRAVTGCLAPETEGGVIVQDLTTMDAVRERLHPHPLCPACGGGEAGAAAPLPDPAALEPGPGARMAAEVTEELRGEMDRTNELVGSHVGVLAGFDDSAIDQSPLKVARVRVGPPDRGTAGPRTVAALDLYNLVRARRRGVHAAALTYVERLAAIRRAEHGTRETLAAAGWQPVAHHELATWSGLPAAAERDEPWLAATSLLSGQPRIVPAAAVYPFGHRNAGLGFEPTSAGCGAGADLTEAVRRGLLSALAYEALRRAASGTPGHRLAFPAPEPGSEIDFLHRTVRNLGLTVDLIALPAEGPAHVVAVRSGVDDAAPAPAWAVGAALARPDALVEALRDLAGAVQLHRQPDAKAPVDLGDPLLPALDPRTLPVTGTADVDVPAATVRELLEHLRAAGRDVLVVQTTPADLRRQGSVTTVRVLLTRAG